jgi:hypothetical protein
MRGRNTASIARFGQERASIFAVAGEVPGRFVLVRRVREATRNMTIATRDIPVGFVESI